MNTRPMIDCLRVCMKVAYPVFGRDVQVHVCVLAVMLLVSVSAAVSVHADDYEIIVENNLFNNERQKWEMEIVEKKDPSQGGSGERQKIEQISLFGTVIKDSTSYAVMRVTKQAEARKAGRRATRNGGRGKKNNKSAAQLQDTKRPYAVGDFIGGYQVVEINPDLVLLQDSSDKKRYEVFMNDTQTERTVVRTEIAEDRSEASKPGQAKTRRPPKSPGDSSKSSASAKRMRQRFERDIQRLRNDKNDAAAQQAERGWKKLQPLMPSLDEKEQKELMNLRSELDSLRK